MAMLPRVELIEPFNRLPDSASPRTIHSDEQSFMRGIFYYADLPKEKWGKIFDQSDVTIRTLRRASKVLDKKLKESWTQGKDLDFELIHNSGTGEIELTLNDPAVEDRVVRASRRSRGFTHFFALKTILNARVRTREK